MYMMHLLKKKLAGVTKLGPFSFHEFQHLGVVQLGNECCQGFLRYEPCVRHVPCNRIRETNRAVDLEICRYALVLQVVYEHTLMPDPMHADVWILARAFERLMQYAMPLDTVVLHQRLSPDTRRIEYAEHWACAVAHLEDQRV